MSTSVPHLGVTNQGGACVIELARSDMTDGAYIQQVGEEIHRIVTGLKDPKVVVNFCKVQRLSSAALGMLVATSKTLDDRRGQMRLANVDDKLHDIFKMTKLHKVMPIHGSIQKAVESFG